MILALDLGSTSFKAGVFDEESHALGLGDSLLAYSYPVAGHVELSLAGVQSTLAVATQQALQNAGVGTDAISAIAVSSQAQTFCLWKDAYPFISWQDGRALDDLPELEMILTQAAFADNTSFSSLDPCLCISKLFHLKRQHSSSVLDYERVVHLPEYIVWCLTGEWVLDRNLAAMSGLYSLHQDDWWRSALDAVGLEREQLPRLIDVGAVAGHTVEPNQLLELTAGIPVILAGNDQTAGACGASIDETGSTLITLGTAQVVYQHTDQLPNPGKRLIRGRYPKRGYYRMWADNCGGNLITWAHSILNTGSDIDSLFSAAAGSSNDCRGLRFDGDPIGGTGCWSGIGKHHTSGDFARALIQFLCDRVKHGVEEMSPVDNYLVAGGGACSNTWLEMLSTTLEFPLRRVETSPLDGAARLANMLIADRNNARNDS